MNSGNSGAVAGERREGIYLYTKKIPIKWRLSIRYSQKQKRKKRKKT